MNVNFYVTCIADVVKAGVAKNTVTVVRETRLQDYLLGKARML